MRLNNVCKCIYAYVNNAYILILFGNYEHEYCIYVNNLCM